VVPIAVGQVGPEQVGQRFAAVRACGCLIRMLVSLSCYSFLPGIVSALPCGVNPAPKHAVVSTSTEPIPFRWVVCPPD
jgi:hypothetical protein